MDSNGCVGAVACAGADESRARPASTTNPVAGSIHRSKTKPLAGVPKTDPFAGASKPAPLADGGGMYPPKSELLADLAGSLVPEPGGGAEHPPKSEPERIDGVGVVWVTGGSSRALCVVDCSSSESMENCERPARAHNFMQCRDPTFDPRAVVRPTCASATHWNATEWLGLAFAYDPLSSRPSDMSRVCFWPCDAPGFHLERAVHTLEAGIVLAAVLAFLSSRRLSASRAAWVALATAASVGFAFALLSYLMFSRSTDSRFAAWAAAGAVALAQLVAARAIPFDVRWTAGYAIGAGALGFAAARALVPAEIDARAAVALETLLCVAAFVACLLVVPSPLVTLALFVTLTMVSILAAGSAHKPPSLEERVRALEDLVERSRQRKAGRRRSKSPTP